MSFTEPPNHTEVEASSHKPFLYHEKAQDKSLLGKTKPVLLLAAFLNLLAIWIVIAMTLRGVQHACELPSSFESRYTRSRDYMSLDHSYDHFWNNLTLNTTGLIRTSDSGHPRIREIAM